MVAQIPLTWQLTDFICALGLGFGYGAVYWIVRGLLMPLNPRQAMLRRWLRTILDGLWAAAAAIYTRAWVLTDSHAVQVRWSIVLGVLVGCGVFWMGAAPVLTRWGARGRRLVATAVAPPFAALGRVLRRLHLWALPRREHRRLRYDLRRLRRAQRAKSQQKAAEHRKSRKNQKDFYENEQKELQNPGYMYYNNL